MFIVLPLCALFELNTNRLEEGKGKGWEGEGKEAPHNAVSSQAKPRSKFAASTEEAMCYQHWLAPESVLADTTC